MVLPLGKSALWPFGPLSGWAWAAGTAPTETRGFNRDGLPSSYTLAGETRSLTYDADSRLYQVTDSTSTQTYTYVRETDKLILHSPLPSGTFSTLNRAGALPKSR